MPSFNSVPVLALAVPLLIKSAHSANISCGMLEDETRKFTEYNGTKTYAIPALKIDGYTDGQPNKLSEDGGSQWNLISRVSHPRGSTRDSWNRIWVDTGNSNTTDITGCMESTSLTATTGFAFSEKVLRRSLEDKGDCKTMLGEECVAALERHYHASGVAAMRAASCMQPTFNTTIPKECSDELVNGHESWLGNMFRTGVGFNYSIEERWDEANCTSDDENFQPLNGSITDTGGIGGPYNVTMRFPQPTFFTFFPNRTDAVFWPQEWDNDVHVVISCLHPEQIQEGSEVPPTAEEILKEEGVKFSKNARSKGAATSMKPFFAYLGLVAGAAVVLL